MMTEVFRRSIVAWVVAAVGCNSVLGLEETRPHDAAEDGNGPSDGRVDAVVDPNDFDGDGVANEIDNCVSLANPDQHDEDRDDYGDACDNCPSGHNPMQEDNEEAVRGLERDGVGDRCDPNRESPGDRLVFFDAFSKSIAGWTEKGGTWEYIQDHVVQTDRAARKAFRFVTVGTYNEVYVNTLFQIKELAPPVGSEADPARSVGVAFHLVDDGRTAFVCRWGSDGKPSPTTRVQLVRRANEKDVDIATSEPTGGFQADAEIELKASIRPLANPSLSCSTSGDGARGDAEGNDRTAPPGSFGLFVDGANVSFEYLEVYTRDRPAR